jgi:hypothetical protein
VWNVKGKIYFAAGAVAGLLTGSRLGRGLYDRVAKTAGAVTGNSTVRQGVSSAGEKAVEVARSAGGGVGHKVTELRRHGAEKHGGGKHGGFDEDDADDAEEAPDGGTAAERAGRAGRHDRATAGAVNGTVVPPGSPAS